MCKKGSFFPLTPIIRTACKYLGLQITNLAAGFILRPAWRGSNTVTAIPPNPLPIVTTQTDLNSQVDQNCICNTKWDYNENLSKKIYIIYQLEVKSEARIQPLTNSLPLFHRATLCSLHWVYKLQTTELRCFTTFVWRRFL